MSGPLPGDQTRRRNAPTIPTTKLPAGGRRGANGRALKAPALPRTYRLGRAGTAWWRWAWALPQACAWDDGALYAIARRAQLEDELAALADVAALDLSALLDLQADQEVDLEDLERALHHVLATLKSRAAGATTLMREMRELDNRLGLNPKAMAELRWTIVDDTKPTTAAPAPAGKGLATVTRIRAVDPDTAAG